MIKTVQDKMLVKANLYLNDSMQIVNRRRELCILLNVYTKYLPSPNTSEFGSRKPDPALVR